MSPRKKQIELPNMPERDELGEAAEALIAADDRLEMATKQRDEAEDALFKLMRKQGRQSLSVNNYRFSVRVRPTREIVAISRPK